MNNQMLRYLLIKNTSTAIMLSIILLVSYQFILDKIQLTNLHILMLIIGIFVFMWIKAICNTKYWGYSYNQERIMYTKGFFKVVTVIIPIRRVQQITTISNPILDRMGLVIISIVTTTVVHTLLPVKTREAGEIAEFIITFLGKESDGTMNEI